MSDGKPSKSDPIPLDPSIHSKQIITPDLSYHTLQCGQSTTSSGSQAPLLLLIHGFPELAYSWRKIMPALAQAGYFVVAYDQRGYGRTSGWREDANVSKGKVDESTFSLTNNVRDAMVLVDALGYQEVHCVVGHDFGAVGASSCALMRPDFFKSVILMSHPFKGSPKLQSKSQESPKEPTIHDNLLALSPSREHYKWYYASQSPSRAAPDLDNLSLPSTQTFLRHYFYLKSGDWPGNKTHALQAWNAEELAKMPWYYVMLAGKSVVENCKMLVQGSAEARRLGRKEWFDHLDHDEVGIADMPWLSDHELGVYAREWARTGWRGGLQWYVVMTDSSRQKDLDIFAGRKLEVPALFVSGDKDWGMFQEPGVAEKMGEVCLDFRGTRVVEGAGHWVQQEQPEKVVELVLEFLEKLDVGERGERTNSQQVLLKFR